MQSPSGPRISSQGPGRQLAFGASDSEKQRPDKLELTGIGIFGGDDDDDEAEDKSDLISDDEYVDEVEKAKGFGARKQNVRRLTTSTTTTTSTTMTSLPAAADDEPLEEGGAFTFRRGRFPPKKSTTRTTTSTTTTTTTTSASLEVDEGLGGLDLGSEEDEDGAFDEGQRLIPSHVFKAPQFRQQVRKINLGATDQL